MFRNDKWDELGIAIGRSVIPQPGIILVQGLDNMGKVRNDYMGRIVFLILDLKQPIWLPSKMEISPGFSRTIP